MDKASDQSSGAKNAGVGAWVKFCKWVREHAKPVARYVGLVIYLFGGAYFFIHQRMPNVELDATKLSSSAITDSVERVYGRFADEFDLAKRQIWVTQDMLLHQFLPALKEDGGASNFWPGFAPHVNELRRSFARSVLDQLSKCIGDLGRVADLGFDKRMTALLDMWGHPVRPGEREQNFNDTQAGKGTLSIKCQAFHSGLRAARRHFKKEWPDDLHVGAALFADEMEKFRKAVDEESKALAQAKYQGVAEAVRLIRRTQGVADALCSRDWLGQIRDLAASSNVDLESGCKCPSRNILI